MYDNKLIDKWIEELNSDHWVKCKSHLSRHGNKRCAIGVLCEILIKDRNIKNEYHKPHEEFLEDVYFEDNLDVGVFSVVATLNDTKRGWKPVIEYLESIKEDE